MSLWSHPNPDPAPLQKPLGIPTPDAELARAARGGDKKAFVEIVARHQAMVCGIAFGILNDFAASEDAAQEAFLTAWRKMQELREPDRLRSWLAQIARNAALGLLRRTGSHRHDSLDEAELMPADEPGPDTLAAQEEEASLVRQSLSQLPENYRLPLVLYYREGQSVRAVAEALSLSEDAVKQRLARGRELLRDRMSGLIETVMTRTGPTAVFTMTIAAAIGALAAPAAVAGAVFTAAASSASASATATATTSVSTPIFAAMSTSKTFLVSTAVVTALCIPVGYHFTIAPTTDPSSRTVAATNSNRNAPTNAGALAPNFPNSPLFAEWRQLHETHGTNGEAMPLIHKAIAELKDPFRRRAFRAALLAEWVQVDPEGGLAFFSLNKAEHGQRRPFFEEWFSQQPSAALASLMTLPDWEKLARECLVEIARRLPGRIPELTERVAKSDSFWDTRVRDAFAIVAEGGLVAAREAAEKLTGPNREQALAGIAQTWARTDLDGAIAWARQMPEGTDRDEIIRAALTGRAAVDPVAALDAIGLVPPGGRQGYFATTTGARILREAGKSNYDATVAWIAAHPGRLGYEDLLGLAEPVTQRLNADPVGFLNDHQANGTLSAVQHAIRSALLNDSAGQRATIWEWLKKQPETDATRALRSQVLSSSGYQDPELALKLANDLPTTKQGDQELQQLAQSLWNGGQMLHRFDKLMAEAPERMRGPLIESAFSHLRGDTFENPQVWVNRINQAPEGLRARATESVARAWAEKAPDEAIGWVSSLPAGDARSSAMDSTVSSWAGKDPHGAGEWIKNLPMGSERDRSSRSLVFAIAEKNPREAWDRALTINGSGDRTTAAMHAAQVMARKDMATARQWIESGPFPAESKAQLQEALTRNHSHRTSMQTTPQAAP